MGKRRGRKSALNDPWQKAIVSLNRKDREALNLDPGLATEVLKGILDTTNDIIERDEEERWKIVINHQEVAIVDIGRNIVDWVNKFKVVGDVIASAKSEVIAIPWAAVRFILQVPACRAWNFLGNRRNSGTPPPRSLSQPEALFIKYTYFQSQLLGFKNRS